MFRSVFVAFISFSLLVASLRKPTETAKLLSRKDITFRERAKKDIVHECVFAVKLKNLDELKNILIDVSTLKSQNYGKYLSRSEVAALTANPAASSRVIDFLTQHNIEIVDQTMYGEFITARAPIERWEAIFETSFYQIDQIGHDEEPITSVVRAKEYFLPSELTDSVSSVFNTIQMPARKRARMRTFLGATNVPLIEFGTVTPLLLNQYYNISSNIGNKLGSQSVWESIGQDYSPQDLTDFQTNFDLPVEPVAFDFGGFNSSETCVLSRGDCGEANLDVQYLMAVSQVTPTIYYYDNSTDFLLTWEMQLLNMTNPPLVNSISYGAEEYEILQSEADSFDTMAIILGTMGVTITVSSGDDGAPGVYARYGAENCGYSPEWPASSPYILSVGASQGPESGKPEIACSSNTGGVITSGGGFSNLYPRPDWQVPVVDGEYFSAVSIALNQPVSGYNISGRAYPDVSLLGFDYYVLLGGNWSLESGTSASSPVMAAMIALVNAERLARGNPPLGWITSTLYNYSSSFTNDITSGNNNCAAGRNLSALVCCQEGFDALTGWDPVTGFGSVNFERFNSFFNPAPSSAPTPAPTYTPEAPTPEPSAFPTANPTDAPTDAPTENPTTDPTAVPSATPTTDSPSAEPTPGPTELPGNPTLSPVADPTQIPSESPSALPSDEPTAMPLEPSFTPSSRPSPSPIAQPTYFPTNLPSRNPAVSADPSTMPSPLPSREPTYQPVPTLPPTSAAGEPSSKPTTAPTYQNAITVSFGVTQVLSGFTSGDYDSDPASYQLSIAQTSAAALGNGITYTDISGIVPTFPSSSRRQLQSSTAVSVTYTVTSSNVYGFTSSSAAVSGLSNNLLSAVNSGSYTNSLQANAVVNGATALASATALNEIIVFAAESPTASPVSSPTKAAGLSDGGKIAIAVVFSILGTAAILGAFYYFYLKPKPTALLNPLMDPY